MYIGPCWHVTHLDSCELFMSTCDLLMSTVLIFDPPGSLADQKIKICERKPGKLQTFQTSLVERPYDGTFMEDK